MKRLILTTFLVVALISCSNQESETKSQQPGEQAAEMSMAKISVPTIQCASCANNVQQAIVDLPGMQEAKVDLKAKIVSVSYHANELPLKKIENAIADAGYDANDTKRNPEAYAELDACCQIPASDDKL